MANLDKSFLTGNIPIPPLVDNTIAKLTATTNSANTAGLQNGAASARGFAAPPLVNTLAADRGNINPSNLNTNAFSHEDSGTGEEVKLNFQTNILDNYDVATYHFKLFMVSTENARTGNIFSVDSQIIIAESGVSDLTIDKVELNAVAVPSVESGTGTQTTMKFEIVEPSGAGLLDKMFYESVALGIGNWLVMPCYLQLSFKGRTPDTSEADDDGSPGGISGLRWVWPIKLSNAKANVTTVGTRYEFDAIVYNELAQSNSYFSIQHNIVLNGVDTFQSAMTDLENKLNQDQFIKLMDNYSIPDSYKIVVDPKIAPYKIRPSDDNKNSVRSGDYKILKDKTATFNSGTGVDKIIDALLANTEEYQVQMVGSQNQSPGGTPGTINQNIDQMKKFWRITTETRPIAFDKRRQDNAVEITVFVFEYDLGVNPASPTTTGGTAGSIDASKRRLKEYINKKILRKKYNYMFTGLNDQVITFDLNMNFSFAVAMARFGGIYYSSASKDIGPVIQHNAEQEANVTDQVRKVISMQNDASPANTQAVRQRAIDDVKRKISASTLDQATKDRYSALLEQSKPENRLAFFNQARISGGTQNNGTLTPTRFSDARFEAAKTNATTLANPVGNADLKFVSNVDINSAAVQQAFQDSIATGAGKLRPIPFRETQQEGAVGHGVESNRTSGKNKLASLFSTALYSTLDASLLHIKLTIKGDPFWLFPQPVAGTPKFIFNTDLPVDQAIANLKSKHKTTDTVNLFGTDNFIIVRFRTPRIYNETTNPDNPDPFTEVEAFSGVYRVLTIISKFEMGKFSQELTCLLDPVINTADFIREIENNAATIDIPTTAADLIGAKIPITSVKTQRISNNIEDRTGGIVNTTRNTAGQVVSLGSQTVGQIDGIGKSNIPDVDSIDVISKVRSNITGP